MVYTREDIIAECIITERDYCQDLKLLIDVSELFLHSFIWIFSSNKDEQVFKTPLSEQGILTEKEFYLLFSNVHEIYELSLRLRKDFENVSDCIGPAYSRNVFIFE